MTSKNCLGLESIPFQVCPKTGMELAEIPAGPFFAGHRRGKKLESPGFRMARHPVTNAQWQQFASETQYAPETDPETYLQHWYWFGKKELTPDLANHPVTWISYMDSLHYAKWADLQLPNEWQWEKASRGLDGKLCPWGNDVYLAPTAAHIRQKSTAPVDAYAAVRTAFGCEQTIGNVAEFCIPSDWPVGDVIGDDATMNAEAVTVESQVTLRGSCYLRKSHRTMVCSHRRKLSASRRNSWTGFRLCKLEGV